MRAVKRVSRFRSHAGVLLLGLLAVFALYGAIRSYMLKRASVKEREMQQREIEEREREISELQAKLEHFESGEGLELEARGRLNLQKPGENVLIIVDDRNGQGDVSGGSGGERSVWQRIIGWFGRD